MNLEEIKAFVEIFVKIWSMLAISVVIGIGGYYVYSFVKVMKEEVL